MKLQNCGVEGAPITEGTLTGEGVGGIGVVCCGEDGWTIVYSEFSNWINTRRSGGRNIKSPLKQEILVEVSKMKRLELLGEACRSEEVRRVVSRYHHTKTEV